MKATGLATRVDTTGNLIGLLESPAGPRARTLLLGSHRHRSDAGRSQRARVLLPIVALAELRRRNVALPFAVEVLGFSEEEGCASRAHIGSKGYSGQLRASDLNFADAEGATIRAALEAHNGGSFALPKSGDTAPATCSATSKSTSNKVRSSRRRTSRKGVVSAIAGQTRAKLVFKGRAGHAGTTPMNLRRDALGAQRQFTLAAEALAKRIPGFSSLPSER